MNPLEPWDEEFRDGDARAFAEGRAKDQAARERFERAIVRLEATIAVLDRLAARLEAQTSAGHGGLGAGGSGRGMK